MDSASWIIRHLWAPLMGLMGAGWAATWGMLNKKINDAATRLELNGLGERVSRNEIELERRRNDIQRLFDEDDKLRDHMDTKVDQLRAEMQSGFRDLSNLITGHLMSNGNGKGK